MKRIALFVDGANCLYAQKQLGWKIDMQKLLDYCREDGMVTAAAHYSGDALRESEECFLNKLHYIGYSIVTKPVKTILDVETGEKFQKANMDVEIAVDMIKLMDQYDEAVLVSGDGDFISVIRYLQANNKTVKVISEHSSTARELIWEIGMNHIKLDDIRDRIERREVKIFQMYRGAGALKAVRA